MPANALEIEISTNDYIHHRPSEDCRDIHIREVKASIGAGLSLFVILGAERCILKSFSAHFYFYSFS